MAIRGGLSFSVFIAVLVIAHLVLHVALGVGAAAPDLATVAVLFAARAASGAGAAATGLVIGVLIDALSLTTFGAQALIKTIVGYLGSRSRDLFEGDSLLFIGLYVFLGKWLHDSLYFVITRPSYPEPWSELITSAPIAALYAAFAAMVALTLYRGATGER